MLQTVTETIFWTFLWPVEPLSARAQYAKNLKKKCSLSHCSIIRYCQLNMSAVILIAVDSLSNTTESEKTNKLIDDPDGDVH